MLTCTRKPTQISLIYRTEPTTKTCKTEKLKSNKRICSEVPVHSLGNPRNQSWRRKGRLRREGFAEMEVFKPGMKEQGGDGIRVLISMNVSSITSVQWMHGATRRRPAHRTSPDDVTRRDACAPSPGACRVLTVRSQPLICPADDAFPAPRRISK